MMELPSPMRDERGSSNSSTEHSRLNLYKAGRQWSEEGETSDCVDSNPSAKSRIQRVTDEAEVQKDSEALKRSGGTPDRERSGRRDSHDRSHRHHDRKKSQHKSKKKKHRRRSRRSSSVSSKSSKSRSRSSSRHRRRRHRSRSRSNHYSSGSQDGHSEGDRWRYHRTADRNEESNRNDEPNSTIMIRGLAPHLTETDIAADITECGVPVKEIRLVRHRDNGMSRGFAFLEFNTVEDAVRYMEQRKGFVLFYGQYEANLIYSFERHTGDRFLSNPPKDWYCSKCSAHNFKRREVCYRCGASKAEDGVAEPTEEISKHATTTLLLKNLDTLTTEDGIMEAIQFRTDSGCIPLKSVQISRESVTNLSRGVCFVETNTVSDAVRLFDCLTQSSLEVDDRILSVAYCKPPQQTVALNSAAAAALAAAQWSVTSSQSFDAEVERLAEYSASLYAKNPEEKASYLAYYREYYRNQQTHVGNVTSRSGNNGTEVTPRSGTSSGCLTIATDQPARSISPNMSRLQFDESTSYYYDPLTLLYYDGSTQHFYDSLRMEYLTWDPQKREYVSVSERTTTPVASVEKPEKPKAKEFKIKVSKSVLKDTLRQAVKFNDKKNMKLSVKMEAPGTALAEIPETRTKAQQDPVSYEGRVSVVGGSIPGKLTLLEALGKESDSDEDVSSRSTEENFMDLEKMACTLCKRQFPSYEVLQKHSQLSSLHLSNLSNLRKSEVMPFSPVISYRDRAKERRKHFGPEITEPKNSLKEVYMEARKAKEDTFFTDSAKEGIKDDNIGNRLLQKMGWKAGVGLGKHENGRTDIIPTEIRTEKAGLGMTASQSTIPAPGDRYTKARQLTLARYRELEQKKNE